MARGLALAADAQDGMLARGADPQMAQVEQERDSVLLGRYRVVLRRAQHPEAAGREHRIEIVEQALTMLDGTMRNFREDVPDLVQERARRLQRQKLRPLQVHPDEVDRIDRELRTQIVQAHATDFD